MKRIATLKRIADLKHNRSGKKSPEFEPLQNKLGRSDYWFM